MDLFINITFGVLTIAFVIIFCLFLALIWTAFSSDNSANNIPIEYLQYVNRVKHAK